MNFQSVTDVEVRHAHLFCGLGGGAKGFNRSSARVGNLRARFRCLGGIDHDPAAIRDFGKVAGVPGTLMDLFDRGQYTAFHGREPPAGWREAAPVDIRRAFGERPHSIFLSAPCKGFSGLLSETTSATDKYQALNRLTLRGVWLALEAYKDDPVELFVFENVPRIATRGRHLLDQIVALFRAYGYAVAETTHDCGVIGNLAQSRKRFLLVARHREKVPNYMYEPPQHRLRGVGEVLGRLPIPGPVPGLGGPMHRMPSLNWKTWVRLAFVKAGSDWRSLNELKVEDGVLADYGIEPGYGYNGMLGVTRWDEAMGVVSSESRPTNGKFAVADPRIDGHAKSVQMGVGHWDQPAAVVKGDVSVGTGRYAIADPRITERAPFSHVYRIIRWDQTAPGVTSANAGTAAAVADPRHHWHPGASSSKLRVTEWGDSSRCITGSQQVASGAQAVADPRVDNDFGGMRVIPWPNHAGAVTGQRSPGSSAMCVADPRPASLKPDRPAYLTGGHYGVVGWDDHSGAVSAHPKNNNGPWSVADPRIEESHGHDGHTPALPAPNDKLVCVIRAMDGTWHRPFTTLELAALQSLIEPEEHLELDGLSDSAWRERIGNMVPPDAATAVGNVMARTLLGAWTGETFTLSSEPIWVRNVAVALAASA